MVSPVSFSALDRADLVQKLQQTTFDLVIIGGGITGAGIALDAASRNLKVALIEKDDFASGTSSRSTKLIHGGLRYLENFEFGLVREVARERAVLQANAPHLVKAEKMLLPLLKNGNLHPLKAIIGVTIYDYLAGVKPVERCKYLTKHNMLKHEPLLSATSLEAAILYTEYRTDDARLTIEVLKTAAQKGAVCLNYCKANDLEIRNNKVNGVSVYDQFSGNKFLIKGRVVVNATGPWLDEFRTDFEKTHQKRLYHTKGVHVVVPFSKLPVKQSLYFETQDKRMIFVIPRGNVTYFGTTDTLFSESTDNPLVTTKDVLYLLNNLRQLFPEILLTEKDIFAGWAGIRPLIYEEGKKPSEISRKDEIWISDNGLISIAGGKLTAYRKMAEKVVDLVIKKTQKPYIKSGTKKIVLSGGNFKNEEELQRYIIELQTAYPEVEQVQNLVNKYGSNSQQILNRFRLVRNLLHAELEYCIEHEMTCTITDFIVRRTGNLFFNFYNVQKDLPEISSYLKKHLNLNSEVIKNQLQNFDQVYKNSTIFKQESEN